MKKIISTVFSLLFIVADFSLFASDMSRSSALISVYKQPVDFDFPWKRGQVYKQKHIAVFCKIPVLTLFSHQQFLKYVTFLLLFITNWVIFAIICIIIHFIKITNNCTIQISF